jgi:hypothetical protein
MCANFSELAHHLAVMHAHIVHISRLTAEMAICVESRAGKRLAFEVMQRFRLASTRRNSTPRRAEYSKSRTRFPRARRGRARSDSDRDSRHERGWRAAVPSMRLVPGQTLRFLPNTSFRGPLALLAEWEV